MKLSNILKNRNSSIYELENKLICTYIEYVKDQHHNWNFYKIRISLKNVDNYIHNYKRKITITDMILVNLEIQYFSKYFDTVKQ